MFTCRVFPARIVSKISVLLFITFFLPLNISNLSELQTLLSMKQLYAKIFACGARFDNNFGLRRYFWQEFWPAALFLAKILACGAIFDRDFGIRRYFWQKFLHAALGLTIILACGAIFGKNFGLRCHFWQKIFNRYESAFFENLLQEGV